MVRTSGRQNNRIRYVEEMQRFLPIEAKFNPLILLCLVLGPPRELHTVSNLADKVIVTWLPPYPLRGKVTAYRLKYNVHTSNENPRELTLRRKEVSCDGVGSNLVVDESLCHKLRLQPMITYRLAVQARTEGGDWGDWSRPHYVTTRPSKAAIHPTPIPHKTSFHKLLMLPHPEYCNVSYMSP